MGLNRIHDETKFIFNYINKIENKKNKGKIDDMAKFIQKGVFETLNKAFNNRNLSQVKSINKDVREMASNMSEEHIKELNRQLESEEFQPIVCKACSR